MSDIVERLRANVGRITPYSLDLEAADEIERLRQRLAEAERDAARYRFVRGLVGAPATSWPEEPESPEHLDALIDRARLADGATADQPTEVVSGKP